MGIAGHATNRRCGTFTIGLTGCSYQVSYRIILEKHARFQWQTGLT